MEKDVLILGGGIAGLQAALELAGARYQVHLVTDEAAIGGKLVNTEAVPQNSKACLWASNQLNISALYLGGNLHTSTTVLGSLITRVQNEQLVQVHYNTKLSEFSGEAGKFTAVLADAQTGEEKLTLTVGAVILAAGFSMFDARQKGEYGYGYYKNVVTSLEYENILATNRLTGDILRPSDGRVVKKVAFIQCVGSRDMVSEGEYCSSICCMFTAKEAIMTKEYQSDTEVTVYYLDLRACGKNFDDFLNQAKELGANYVRTMISEVKEDPVTENLLIQYINEGKVAAQEYDLVVLATGVRPQVRLVETAKHLGLNCNKYGFIDVNPILPIMTNQEGIFSIGGSQGPLDVSESLALASAAAQAATAVIGQLQHSQEAPQRDTVKAENALSIGVFLCESGIKAMGAEPAAVMATVEAIFGVGYTTCQPSLCTPEKIAEMQALIKSNRFNRLVVAPCALKTNIHLFQEKAAQAGMNRMLVELAAMPLLKSSVQEANSVVVAATAKAVANVKTYQPLHWHNEPVVKKALILGGGITGLTAALSLAQNGFPSTIVEKTGQVGGYLKNLTASIEIGGSAQELQRIIEEVSRNEKITVLTNAEVIGFNGYQGNFSTTLEYSEDENTLVKKLEHGVLIVATGTSEAIPAEYLYGLSDNVNGLSQAEQILDQENLSEDSKKTYAFIQCVGSRDAKRSYCSRTCCAQTIQQALKLKEKSPKSEVYVFYRDIRTPGYLELAYREARDKGIIFIHYSESEKPIVVAGSEGKVILSAIDPTARRKITIQPDKIFLAGAQTVPSDTVQLAELLHLPLNSQGFLTETHAGFGKIAFPGGGIFIAGSAHSPKSIPECIVQARGAAGRAAKVLAQPFLRMSGIIAEVDTDKCAACLTCVRTCPYKVPKISREKKEMGAATISPVECRGCGICSAECPNKAIELANYADKDVLERLAAVLTEVY